MEKPALLTASTFIPIGAVAVVFGAAMWLTTIFRQGQANATQIQEVKAEQDKHLDRVYNKLDKMEEKIDRIIEKTSK